MENALPPHLYADLVRFARRPAVGEAEADWEACVHRLETELAIALHSPGASPLVLSEAGERLLRASQQLLHAAGDVLHSLSGGQQLSGSVCIDTPSAIARGMLLPHIPAFRARYPQVSIRIIVTGRHTDLFAEHIDLALRACSEPPPHVVAHALMPLRYLICATPAYLAEYGTPRRPADLANHGCLHLGEALDDDRWTFVRGPMRETVQVQGSLVVNHSDLRLQGVLSGLGVGCLPEFVARRPLEAGLVQQLLPEWQFQSSHAGTAYLMYPRDRQQAPQVRAFVEHLCRAMAPE